MHHTSRGSHFSLYILGNNMRLPPFGYTILTISIFGVSINIAAMGGFLILNHLNTLYSWIGFWSRVTKCDFLKTFYTQRRFGWKVWEKYFYSHRVAPFWENWLQSWKIANFSNNNFFFQSLIWDVCYLVMPPIFLYFDFTVR